MKTQWEASETERNEKGERLIQYTTENKLDLINVFFFSKKTSIFSEEESGHGSAQVEKLKLKVDQVYLELLKAIIQPPNQSRHVFRQNGIWLEDHQPDSTKIPQNPKSQNPARLSPKLINTELEKVMKN